MHRRPNFPVNTVLIIISLLAVAGGLASVFVASPQSFDLGRLALLGAIIAPENTPNPSSTPSLTPEPASPTAVPTATASKQRIAILATDTSTPTDLPPSPARSTATPTATGVILPADVRALAIVTMRVGAALVRIHDSPNGAVLVAAIPGGTPLQVLFGSASVDGVEWLPVRLASGRVGWVAGYLLTITLERAVGTDTALATATEADTATTVPATAQPGPTSQAPPPTAVPTALPNPTETPVNLPTVAQTTHPVIKTSTPRPPLPTLPPSTDTPLATQAPPPTNTP
jgi:hypothetical protein